MKNTNWKDIAELFGIAAIVASPVFVGLQMRQAGQIAVSEADASYLSATVEILSLLSDHSEIWVRGNAGEVLDEAEAVIFENMVIAINDRAFIGNQQLVRLGIDEEEIVDLHDFAIFLFQNPGARRVWAAREANLVKYRNILDPSGLNLMYHSNAIQSDLTKLDPSQD